MLALFSCANGAFNAQREGPPSIVDPCAKDAAPRALSTAGPRDFEKAELAFKAGMALVESAEHAAALRQLEAALAADPTHALAHLAKAEVHLYVDDDQRARERHLATAVVLLPQNPRAQAAYAKLSQDLGRADEALIHWRCALALRADWPEARYELARLHHQAGRNPEALTEIRAALAQASDELPYHLLHAEILEAGAQLHAAAQAVEAAAKIAGKNAPLYRRAAQLYERADKPAEAAAAAKLADELDPPPPERRLRPLPQSRKKRR